MARQTMRSVSRLALFAIIPLAIGGCAYIDRELNEIAQGAKSPTRAQPLNRVARAEPNQSKSAPVASRDNERSSETRAAAPLASPPSEPARQPAPDRDSAPPVQPSRSPTPVVVPAPQTPANPVQATPAPQPAEPPRIINPAATPPPAPAQPDALPNEPSPAPPRPEPQPAPPNRANISPSRQAGGGLLAGVRPEPAAPIETLSKAQLAARLDHARRLLQRGKVIEARVTLQSVARSVPAAALHELARTYDPYYLGQLPSIDDGSEPRTAASLYQDAINHGASAAGNDLDRLRASYPALR